MNILCQILYDRSNNPLFVIFEQGKFSTPLAILQQHEAEVVYLSVKGEKDRHKLIDGNAG